MSRSLPCTYYELTADTILNRLIKKAIFKIGNALALQSTTNKELLSSLNYFADRLSNVRLDNSRLAEADVRRYLQRTRIPTLRNYYLDILDICLLILEGNGVELIGTGEGNMMHSFIINLENAFESYTREVLRRTPAFSLPVQMVLDGNKEAKSHLFADNSKYDAKPDIVIGSKEMVLAIGDVKYKTKLSEADRYQLIAHAVAYGAKLAMFITPLVDKNDPEVEYIGRIAEIKLYHYRLDLDSEKLFEIEAHFQAWAVALVSGT